MIDKQFQAQYIKELRSKTGLSQRDFAKKLNVSGAYIGQIETGSVALSEKIYQKIIEVFHDYLATANECNNDYIQTYYYPKDFVTYQNGTLNFSNDRILVKIPKHYFYKNINPLKNYSVICALGDSMLPNIHDKDRLIIEHLNSIELIQDNRVYVFLYNNRVYVKRLIYNIDEIIVKSDNIDPIYKTKFIQKEQSENLVIIGQIVGIARDFI